jgi:hypothetical protein
VCELSVYFMNQFLISVVCLINQLKLCYFIIVYSEIVNCKHSLWKIINIIFDVIQFFIEYDNIVYVSGVAHYGLIF